MGRVAGAHPGVAELCVLVADVSFHQCLVAGNWLGALKAQSTVHMRLHAIEPLVEEADVNRVHLFEELRGTPLTNFITQAGCECATKSEAKVVDQQVQWHVPILQRAQHKVIDSFQLNLGGETRSAEGLQRGTQLGETELLPLAHLDCNHLSFFLHKYKAEIIIANINTKIG